MESLSAVLLAAPVPPVVGLLVFGVLGAFAVGALWRGFRVWRRRSRILETPTSPISSAPAGFCEVKGRVQALGDVMQSPYSSSPCVYWKYVVQEYRKSGKSSRWVTISWAQRAVPFLVLDATGAALIQPQGAEWDLRRDHGARTGTFDSPTPELQAFLDKVGIASKGWLFNRNLKVEESFLGLDDELFIMGTARPATPADGAERPGLIVLQGGGTEFIISDSGEAALTSKLKWSSVGAFALGVLLLGFGGIFAFATVVR